MSAGGMKAPLKDLAVFYGERLDESEAAAKALLAEARRVQQAVDAPHMPGRYVPGWASWADVEKSAAAALSGIEAGRAILAEYISRDCDVDLMMGPETQRQREWAGLHLAVSLLAAAFHDHPRYQQRWAPAKSGTEGSD